MHDCGLGRIGLFSQTYNHLRLDLALNVHRGNDALGFYEREGFAPTGELSGGDVIVMRRKR